MEIEAKLKMDWTVITKDPYLFDIFYDTWNAADLKFKLVQRLEPFAKL